MNTKKIIITLIAIALIALLYIFNFTLAFTKEKHYTSYFENINGLQASAHVMVNGARVGKVKNVDLADGMIRVCFYTNDDVKLPEGTKTSVVSEDISGTKALALIPGNGSATIAKGSIIPAKADTTMQEMFDAKITPVLHNAKSLLYHTDSAMQTFDRLVRGDLGRQVKVVITDLHDGMNDAAKTTTKITPILNDAATMLYQLRDVVDSPAQKNQNINKELTTLNKQMEQMASTDYAKELNNIGANMNKLGKDFKKITQENSLLNSKKGYTDANKKLDSFNTTMEAYKKDPPPLITLP